MARVVANITCKVTPNINIKEMATAIADVITDMTGYPCQVVSNSIDAPGTYNRMNMYTLRRASTRDSIENYNTLKRG